MHEGYRAIDKYIMQDHPPVCAQDQITIVLWNSVFFHFSHELIAKDLKFQYYSY